MTAEIVKVMMEVAGHPLAGWLVGGLTFLGFYRWLWKDRERCRYELERMRKIVSAVTISNGILWNRLVLSGNIQSSEVNPVDRVLEAMNEAPPHPAD